jgi:hypothetical protein
MIGEVIEWEWKPNIIADYDGEYSWIDTLSNERLEFQVEVSNKKLGNVDYNESTGLWVVKRVGHVQTSLLDWRTAVVALDDDYWSLLYSATNAYQSMPPTVSIQIGPWSCVFSIPKYQ